MAGDWIPMRLNLSDDPAVIAVANALDLDEFGVVGRLHRLWAWANQHTANGHAPSVTEKWIDRHLSTPGFARALVSAGWLSIDDTGVTFPKFEDWNTKGAKQRLLATKRKRGERVECRGNVAEMSRSHRDKNATTEEKRREEEVRGPAEPVVADPKPKKKTPAKAEPTGPHADAVRGFCDAWARRWGCDYAFNGGKDGDAVKWMLAQVKGDVPRFLSVVRRYLADGSDFVTSNRHGLGLLRSQFSKWLPEPNAIPPPPVESAEEVAARQRRIEEGVNSQDVPDGWLKNFQGANRGTGDRQG